MHLLLEAIQSSQAIYMNVIMEMGGKQRNRVDFVKTHGTMDPEAVRLQYYPLHYFTRC